MAKHIANRLCVACHTFNKGDPNRIGPNLYGVFDQPIAQGHGGFRFRPRSSRMTRRNGRRICSMSGCAGPQDFAHGTKMTFVGLAKAKDRADVIAYLDSPERSPRGADAFETEPAAAASNRPPHPRPPRTRRPRQRPPRRRPARRHRRRRASRHRLQPATSRRPSQRQRPRRRQPSPRPRPRRSTPAQAPGK